MLVDWLAKLVADPVRSATASSVKQKSFTDNFIAVAYLPCSRENVSPRSEQRFQKALRH
jgi:hypothetical protein